MRFIIAWEDDCGTKLYEVEENKPENVAKIVECANAYQGVKQSDHPIYNFMPNYLNRLLPVPNLQTITGSLIMCGVAG